MTVSLAPLTLLVEDKQEVADGYLWLFDDEGIKADHAKEWDEALAMFRVGFYELVIADYNLPGSKMGLQLLVTMKRLVPSSRLILISGAMSPRAEKLAASIPFLDGFYPKTSGLGEILLDEARRAANHAADPTDWRRFGAGYLAAPNNEDTDLQRIDDELRADVTRRD
jgi:DNA-binding NtrC family response regulator